MFKSDQNFANRAKTNWTGSKKRRQINTCKKTLVTYFPAIFAVVFNLSEDIIKEVPLTSQGGQKLLSKRNSITYFLVIWSCVQAIEKHIENLHLKKTLKNQPKPRQIAWLQKAHQNITCKKRTKILLAKTNSMTLVLAITNSVKKLSKTTTKIASQKSKEYWRSTSKPVICTSVQKDSKNPQKNVELKKRWILNHHATTNQIKLIAKNARKKITWKQEIQSKSLHLFGSYARAVKKHTFIKTYTWKRVQWILHNHCSKPAFNKRNRIKFLCHF